MRSWLVLGMLAALAGCSGESSDTLGSGDAGPGEGEGDAGACPSEGRGTLAIEVDSEVPGDVRVTDSEGAPIAGDPTTESRSVEVAAGLYEVSAQRVRAEGEIVGPAYQGTVEGDRQVCVRADETTTVEVVYTREPGSEKLWLTNINGEGQILGFDADALTEGGEHAPDVTLDGMLARPSALRVDALGRLWVGAPTGELIAFETERLGASSDAGPDVVLEGDALCGATLPCGPRALAFDAEGALWVATLERIVKLAPSSLDESGEPDAEITITSPDAPRPMALAFDADGNLWVAEENNAGVVRFDAERLTADIADEAADVVIFGERSPSDPLNGPQSLAFDRAGNLWVGYFASNILAHYTPEERAETATILPAVQFGLTVGALPTDLAFDDSGNLWLPGAEGTIVRFDAAELTAEDPTPVVLASPAIGSAAKIALHSVAGPLFIAP